MRHVHYYLRASAVVSLFAAMALTQVTSLRAETTIDPDVIYGRKLGMALTMDVLTPDKPNGAGVMFMVSGGWVSGWFDPKGVITRPNPFGKLLDAGFTVFLVRHGSSPVFKVPDAVTDVRNATRFVRLNAAKYKIDPDRIGVCGGSAGGHLSLMLGTTGDAGDTGASDALSKTASRVGAVVAYFPPTDLGPFLNDKRFPALNFGAELVDDVSPIKHASADDAPSLFVVGMKDTLVTPDHSEKMRAALHEKEVPVDLIAFDDAGHGFDGGDDDKAADAMVAWFKKYLVDENPSERLAKAKEERRKNAPPTLSLLGEWKLLLQINNDAADYMLKIERKDKKLNATLISPRSGEYPAEAVSYDAGDFKMTVRRKYDSEDHAFVYKYAGTLSHEHGLQGTISVAEEGGARSGTGTFEGTRK